jgi:hypothetical protein
MWEILVKMKSSLRRKIRRVPLNSNDDDEWAVDDCAIGRATDVVRIVVE